MGIGIAPEGSTLEYTDHYAQQIEALYKQVPEIGSISWSPASPWSTR